MKRVVQWSVLARDDAGSILDYITKDNPAAARRVVQQIGATATGLADFPIGRMGRVAGTYEKVVPKYPYIIAYAMTIGPDGREIITILRVIHTARDWPTEM